MIKKLLCLIKHNWIYIKIPKNYTLQLKVELEANEEYDDCVVILTSVKPRYCRRCNVYQSNIINKKLIENKK